MPYNLGRQYIIYLLVELSYIALNHHEWIIRLQKLQIQLRTIWTKN